MATIFSRGTTFGPYTIGDLLGSGAVSEVYEASDRGRRRGGDQGAQGRRARSLEAGGAARTGGVRPRGRGARQRRGLPRGGRGGRPGLPGDGARVRDRSPAAHGGLGRPPAARAGRADRVPGGRRARRRPRAGVPAPRRQAGEHPRHARRSREDFRPRVRVGRQVRGRDDAGDGPDLDALHVARAPARARASWPRATCMRSASSSTRWPPAFTRWPRGPRRRPRSSRATSSSIRRRSARSRRAIVQSHATCRISSSG